MTAALPAWLLPWIVQSTVLAMLGLALLRLLRVDAPAVRLAWCQVLLPLALLLPWTSVFTGSPSESVARGIDEIVLAVAPASFAGRPGAPAWWPSMWGLVWVWLGGVLLRAGWLAVGLHRLRGWRRSAALVIDPALEWAHVAVPVEATSLASQDTTQPVTWGLRRPVVLVPASLAERPAEQRRAVYVHELLHVARRDMRWVWTEEALRTVLWPLPAVWMLVPALRLAREQVIDAETVRVTLAPRAYVEVLVWCADRTVPRLAPALPFFRRHQLLTRVASLTKGVSMSRSRLVLTSCALAIVLATAGTFVGAVAPLSPALQEAAGAVGPGPLERTATLPTLDVPAPRRTYSVDAEWPAAARAENRSAGFRMHLVVDANGSVAEARVVAPMAYSGANRPVDAIGAALRRAAVDAVRQWHFEPPTVAPMLIVTNVRVGEVPPSSVSQGDQPVRVGGAVSAPRKIYDVAPVYPEAALAARVKGVVIVEAVLEPTGDVASVRVLKSIPELDQAAIDAVRQWKYEPQPYALQMTMTINFTLAADDRQP